jgi:hypothetical protein
MVGDTRDVRWRVGGRSSGRSLDLGQGPGQLGPVPEAELGQDVGDVALDGLAGQEQRGRDLGVAPEATRRAISRSRSLRPASRSVPPALRPRRHVRTPRPRSRWEARPISVPAPIRSARAPASRSTRPASPGSTRASTAPRSRRTQTASSSSPWRSASTTSAARAEAAAAGSPLQLGHGDGQRPRPGDEPPGALAGRRRAGQEPLGLPRPPDAGQRLGAPEGRLGLAAAAAGPAGVRQRLADPVGHLGGRPPGVGRARALARSRWAWRR